MLSKLLTIPSLRAVYLKSDVDNLLTQLSDVRAVIRKMLDLNANL